VKGLPMLIEAWQRVKPSGWLLKIAGPDEAGHLRYVVNKVKSAGLSDCVSFVGPVEGRAKTSLLEEANLFILPSHSESFGMAVAESLAFGLPVLTTTRVPWPELEIRNCGWLSPPNPEDFAIALRHATSKSAAELRLMGLRGREYAAEFRWDRIVEQFASLYDALAAR
jgi:glycosyltransferase involved in cell wall biosynthesis